MSEENLSQHGGIDGSGMSSVHVGQDMVGGDKIGRDKVTYYVFLLGQVLDAVHLQEFLPDFPASEIVSRTIGQSDKRDSTGLSPAEQEAALFAGSILEPLFQPLPGSSDSGGLRYRQILAYAPSRVVNGLKKKQYWDQVCMSENLVIEGLGQPYPPVHVAVWWFEILGSLWREKYQVERQFGFAEVTERIGSSESWGYEPTVMNWYILEKRQDRIAVVPGTVFKPEEFRLFMVGLVSELVHIYRNLTNNETFWTSLQEYVKREQNSPLQDKPGD